MAAGRGWLDKFRTIGASRISQFRSCGQEPQLGTIIPFTVVHDGDILAQYQDKQNWLLVEDTMKRYPIGQIQRPKIISGNSLAQYLLSSPDTSCA